LISDYELPPLECPRFCGEHGLAVTRRYAHAEATHAPEGTDNELVIEPCDIGAVTGTESGDEVDITAKQRADVGSAVRGGRRMDVEACEHLSPTQ
jgi:hypothetical protein